MPQSIAAPAPRPIPPSFLPLLLPLMPGPTPIVRVRVKPELHRRFKAACQAQGLSTSELMKRAIQRELDTFDDSSGTVAAAPVPVAGLVDEKAAATRQLTVRLTAYVRDAATERAQAQDLYLSPWIANLVQSQVSATPVHTDDELQILDASNGELAALGRNINRIARALNEAYFEPERVRLDHLSELSEQIERTQQAILGLVRARRNAWGVVE